MSLDEVVTHNITKTTSVPTRLGFGTPLIMVVDAVTPNVLTKYTSVKAITDAGYPVTHPAVKAATAVFSQNPRPTSVMIGKRSNVFTQSIDVFPLITTTGFHYKFSVVDPDGVTRDIDYTVLAAATTTTIAAALAPLIQGASALITATASTTKVIVTTVTAGKLFDLTNLPNPDHLKIKDNTTDPGIAADLTTIEALDNKSWYAVILDWAGKATAVAAAAWLEARRKIAGFDTSDSECVSNGVSNDVGSTLKGSAYARSFVEFAQAKLLSYQSASVFGIRLPTTPGKANWAYVTLSGVPYSLLTDGQKAVLLGKNINTYTEELAHQNGFSASGEFLDVTHGSDWLHARMQERVFKIIKDASDAGRKIPFTNSGRDLLLAGVRAQLDEGVTNEFLASDPAPVASGPDVSEIDPADKGERNWPELNYTATLSGAINKVTINGTLTL